MKSQVPRKEAAGPNVSLYEGFPNARKRVTRRNFVLVSMAGFGTMASPLKQFAQTENGKNKMPESNKSALMLCDFQLGIGDQAYAKDAVPHAAAALEAARKAGMLVVFSRVCFQPGYMDISPRNQAFAMYKAKDMLPPNASHLIPIFEPHPAEILVTKDRFNAFSGNALKVILRSQGIAHLVMAGVATSGVILSTFCLAADEDYGMTILSDACADPKASLHEELMTNLFPRSATVLPVGAWIKSLTT